MSSRNQTMMHKLRVYQDMQDIRNREKARGGTKKKYASRYSARHTNPVTEDPANQGLNWWERMLFNATQPFSNLSAAGMNYAQKVQEGEGSWFSQDIRDLYKDLQSRKGFEKTVRYGQIGKQLWRMMNGKEIDEEEEPELADLSELFDRDMYDEENAPRLNFLAPRKYRAARYLHDIRLRGEGWLRGQEGDYELLNNYITKNYGSLPVYQTARDYDNISRKDLVAIGNRLNMVNSSLGHSAYLPGDYHFALPDSHADSSAFYIDPITNQYYQKTWDIEKYKNGVAYENIYEDSEKELANKLDDFGSPVVITTGFQPVYKTGKNGEKGDIFTLNDILGESPDPQDYANYEAWDVLRKQTNDMMAKRGMFMQDVGPNGEMKYAAKPIEVFGDRVKRHVAEKRYGGREKLRGGRQRRLRIAQDVKNVMENEAIRYDEIQPRQLDEIVVTPTGVQGKYSSDKVNEVIGKQWRNRFSGPGMFDYNIKARNNSTKEIYDKVVEDRIRANEEHPMYADETRWMQQWMSPQHLPKLYKKENGEYLYKPYAGEALFPNIKSPTEIVSPEFDLLSLGIGGKDIWKAGKGLYNMVRSTKSYTGVPFQNIKTFFRNGKFNVFTTPDVNIAETYSNGGTRFMRSGIKGKVFKVYAGRNNKILKLDPPTEGRYYMDRRMPFLEDTKNGRIVKSEYLTEQYLPNPYISKNQKGFANEQMMNRVSDANANALRSLLNDPNPTIRQGAQHELAQLENGIKYNNAVIIPEKEAMRFRPVGRTDELINVSKKLGYDGVEIPKIIDGGYYDKNGTYIMTPFTERIYGNPSKLIFAPVDESFMKTYMANYGEDLMRGLLKTGSGITIDHNSKKYGGRKNMFRNRFTEGGL